MLAFRNGSEKTKISSHQKNGSTNKKRRVHETELLRQCSVGTQTIEKRPSSSESSSKTRVHEKAICKSSENIMLSNSTKEQNSMSTSDVANLYGIYKKILKRLETSSAVHAENYRLLLNEFNKFQTQIDEREKYRNSVVAAMMNRHRLERKVRSKRSAKANRRLTVSLNQISSAVSQLQSQVENFERINLELVSKNEESKEAVSEENNKKKIKKSKKSSFCCCI